MWTLVSLNLRLKDLLGPVTRVKKNKKSWRGSGAGPRQDAVVRRLGGSRYRGTSLIRKSGRPGPYSRTMLRALWQS